MEMEEDRKISVLMISNSIKKKELFRVHIHEHSIRFDNHFAEAIEANEELCGEIKALNNSWKEHEIETDQIFHVMIAVMTRYHNYLKDFYFKEHELDKNGHYIEPISLDRASVHYQFLKNSKKLIKISKKEFEKKICTDEVANYYVDNYVKKGAKFYKSERKDVDGNITTWYFMVVNEKFKISFFITE